MLMNIVDFIPYGNDSPVTRQELCDRTGMSDRAVRKAIEKASFMFPIINLSDGKGYYIAVDYNDPGVKRYFKQELSRIRSKSKSLQGIRDLLEKPKQKDKQLAGQISLFDGGIYE
jgi:hypothetical protein